MEHDKWKAKRFIDFYHEQFFGIRDYDCYVRKIVVPYITLHENHMALWE